MVLWHSENMNVAKILNDGGCKDPLQAIAVDISKLCLIYDIQIMSKWVPWEENELADSISKYYDTDN